jgi:hypothetical protein
MEGSQSSAADKLAAVSEGFRSRYLTYEELTRQVRAWAEAFPSIVRLESICTTPGGRELWLLTIGPDPDRLRPAVWIDGNMHASEISGSSVALAIAEDAILAHADKDAPLRDLPRHLCDLFREDVLLYVLPRMCPDGAEHVLTTGAFVRSNPREHRKENVAPYFRAGDVDGDGQARLMRRRDPAGDFVQSPDVPDLMLPRRIEDEGPFYTVHPEGVIENWDGITIPSTGFVSSTETDMNRNFPFDWQPEPKQIGAGAFATSEPESRAVTSFTTAHPNIFAWMNFHTFGGVYIRPLGDKSDKEMNQADLLVFRQIEEWTRPITGYPMVSGFEEFTYEPSRPLRGELSSFAYGHRGAVGMVCELWDFWHQAGLPLLRPFVWNYQRRTRADVLAIARWDREHNKGRVIGPWRPFVHPQLGPVEIGGFDPRVGIWNPPFERLGEVCEAQARVLFRIAALSPRLRLRVTEAAPLGGGLTAITAVVENLGYLPTYVLASSKELPWNEPVRVSLELGPGVTLASPANEGSARGVGHLGGWGSGDVEGTPAFARSTGEPVRARAHWVVRGSGRVVVRAVSARVGQVEASVEVG